MLKKIEILLHGCNLRILGGVKPLHLKPLIITAIVFGLIFCLWIIGRTTFAFQFFKANSSSCEPTLKPGELFFTSNLKTPRRFALIAYRAVVPVQGAITLVHRICGVPGDIVEIKAGTLFINGKDVDEGLHLKHIYKVNEKYSGSIDYKQDDAYTIPPYADTLYIPLEDRYVKKEQFPCVQYILPAGLRDEDIFRVYQKSWNKDNFGPMRVTPGKFFVLGDNRGRSQDSRYLGLIDQEKVVGTLLWK
jgi:signal peptidase I